jgi:streptogramin lyase
LFKYDISSGICKKLLSDKGDYESLRYEHVTSIFEDNSHKIWFTTEGNGFSYVDGEAEEITRYIPGKDIDFSIYSAMLQDGYGNLWITSTRGLLRLDPALNKLTVYTKKMVLDNTFSYNSATDKKNVFGTSWPDVIYPLI